MIKWIPDRRTVNSTLIVSALVMCIFTLVFRPIPEAADSDILKMLVGALITLATNVVSFDFGSSAGSERKQATIDSMINPQPDRVDRLPEPEKPLAPPAAT